MNNMKYNFVTFGNNVAIINTTPHSVTIQDTDGTPITVPSSVGICGSCYSGKDWANYDDIETILTISKHGTPSTKRELIENNGELLKKFQNAVEYLLIQ